MLVLISRIGYNEINVPTYIHTVSFSDHVKLYYNILVVSWRIFVCIIIIIILQFCLCCKIKCMQKLRVLQ